MLEYCVVCDKFLELPDDLPAIRNYHSARRRLVVYQGVSHTLLTQDLRDRKLAELPPPEIPATTTTNPDPTVPDMQAAPAPAVENESGVVADEQQPEEVTELWMPDEASWYPLTIKTSDRFRHFIIFNLEGSDETVFSNGRDFVSSPGAHSLCLPPGTAALARIQRTGSGLRTIEVMVESTDDWSGTEEEVLLTHWTAHRAAGSGERKCGCGILVVDSYDGLPFAVGDRVRGTMEWHRKRGNWCLRNLVKA